MSVIIGLSLKGLMGCWHKAEMPLHLPRRVKTARRDRWNCTKLAEAEANHPTLFRRQSEDFCNGMWAGGRWCVL